MIAYCYQSGQIEFGNRVPKGALPIMHGKAKDVKSKIQGTAVLAYDNKTWLVPGIRTHKDGPLQALIDYVNWIGGTK